MRTAPPTYERVRGRAARVPPDQAEIVGGRTRWAQTFKGVTLAKFAEGKANPCLPRL